MKKQLLLSVFLVGILIFSFSNLVAADEALAGDTYGHISFVDKAATVIRHDQSENQAVVNLPITAGDQIITSDDGRCEIQFDNGTVIRLDKNSRLKVTTILAPTLTTKWKVTTMHLMRGQMYSMNQSYTREMFQVITPNAAINLKGRAATTIRLENNGDTFIYADKGKFQVMFGETDKDLKVETITRGKAYLVSMDHKISLAKDSRNIEFVGWNDYVNRNFKDLHHGVSKVPKKIYRYNKGLIYWAEKWSSLFGEWVYDDIFGYVWKPADEIFAFSKRPFFHADFTRVNGNLFLVPSQPWGWAPAHLGTWVWMKWGWTWVPGNAFGTGVNQFWDTHFGSSLDYWVYQVYGGWPLYYTYRDYGQYQWENAYRRMHHRVAARPSLKKLPDSIRTLIKKMNKTSVAKLKERLGSNRPNPMIDKALLAKFNKTDKKSPSLNSDLNKRARLTKSMSKSAKRSATLSAKIALEAQDITKPTEKKGKGLVNGHFIMKRSVSRDFNPDIKWAKSRGYNVGYSSKTNSVLCPKLKLNSRELSNRQRIALRGSNRINFKGSKGGYTENSGSTSGSSNTTAAGNSTTSRSGSRSGAGGAGTSTTSTKNK